MYSSKFVELCWNHTKWTSQITCWPQSRTFQIYKQIVQPFWGLLIDVDDFESKLCIYLEDRGATSKHPANGSKGVSSAWLGILFAVLAVATNYTDHSYAKRTALAQNFGRLTLISTLDFIANLHNSPDFIPLSEAIKFFDSSVIRIVASAFNPWICFGQRYESRSIMGFNWDGL